MERNSINTLTVHQLLNNYPESIKIFIQHCPECVGCAFDRFCTIEAVANHYSIFLDEWIESIEAIINLSEKRSNQ